MNKKIILVIIIAILLILIASICIYFSGLLQNWGSDSEQVVIQENDYSIAVKINDKYISKEELDIWIINRIRKVEKALDLDSMEEKNATDMLATLTQEKLELSYDDIFGKLESKLNLSDTVTKIMVKLSGGKTKNCITEVEVKGLDLDTFLKEFDKLQLENLDENLAVNLSVAPDHYYLGVTDSGQLEVIETCGNNFLPSQFFINYGEEDGLNSIRESDKYEHTSAGIAMTNDGIIEGGVRHQFEKTENGFKAKLLVEFPKLIPESILKNHQMHLACEFSNWIKWIAENCNE